MRLSFNYFRMVYCDFRVPKFSGKIISFIIIIFVGHEYPCCLVFNKTNLFSFHVLWELKIIYIIIF